MASNLTMTFRDRLLAPWRLILRWIDNDLSGLTGDPRRDLSIEWPRVVPFLILHLGCLLVIFVGWSPVAVAVAAAMYAIRMFAITGFYHRYFSHKAFRTSRPVQFLMGLLGATSVQRGPLWWAAHHRHHHKHSDQPEDIHSPQQHGFWWSHMGWFLTRTGFHTDESQIPDLVRYPELRLIDRYDLLVSVLTAVGMLGLGWLLEIYAPELGTGKWQMLVWGFFVSTVVLFHATVTINSLSHVFGKRRFATRDQSKNNLWLALLTFGEGWHNNHHHYPGSASQGFRWWEVDLTYYGLRMMNWCGLIWDLKPVPAHVRRELR